jgi:N-acetyl-gamma-glutamyl-phosphate reductase
MNSSSKETMGKLKVAVLGASGYAGAELVRILLRHPKVEITALGGDSTAGQKLSKLYPALRGFDMELEKLDAAGLKGRAELAFLGLPHVQSMATGAPLVKAGIKVVDLSGDFRLKDAKVYEQFYKHAHGETDLLKEAVYGLPELHRDEIKKARLVANPGCYTTTAILGLVPLLKAKKVVPSSIIIDAKSGVSGGGRKLVNEFQFVEVYDNFSAYGVGGVHRHIPEIEQELSLAGGAELKVSFTPHLLPLSRGIFSTAYADLSAAATEAELLEIYSKAYAGHPFVRVYPAGELPTLRSVRGTNYCDIGLKVDARTKRVIVVSCTDNLGKGAAFQAIQNMNLMSGFGETEGLDFSALTT